MRFFSILALLPLLAILALAVQQDTKSVLISYPKDTPDDILARAKANIRAAGGIITHEYTLIKAFAAKASAQVFNKIHELDSSAYHAVIEEDQIVNAVKAS